jgi:type VI secretion system protein ImpM
VGLSRSLIAAWDCWVSAGLAASREAMGSAWQPAWMEAPIWRFTAAAGLFGEQPMSGVWMPSVDRAGRMFPLLIAVECEVAADWFALAEAAGLAALDEDLEPEALAALLPAAVLDSAEVSGSCWWTEGAPRVAPCKHRFEALPASDNFTRMLADKFDIPTGEP